MDRVIKIIKVVSKSILLTAKYLFLCFFSKKKLNDSESVFIVSLTTYGNRLNFVFLTIESILQQKLGEYYSGFMKKINLAFLVSIS